MSEGQGNHISSRCMYCAAPICNWLLSSAEERPDKDYWLKQGVEYVTMRRQRIDHGKDVSYDIFIVIGCPAYIYQKMEEGDHTDGKTLSIKRGGGRHRGTKNVRKTDSV